MSKLTIEIVTANLIALAANYGLEASESYQEVIYNQLKNKISKEDFLKAINTILNTEETFFNKMPPVATFLKFAGKKELTTDQQAKNEVERIILHSKSYVSGKIIFDNPVTNAVARDYKISHINNHLTNSYLDYAKSEATIRKELLEKWLIYFNDNIQSNSLIKIDESNNLTMIGDDSKCKTMLAEQSKVIEQSNVGKEKQKIDLLLINLVKTKKDY